MKRRKFLQLLGLSPLVLFESKTRSGTRKLTREEVFEFIRTTTDYSGSLEFYGETYKIYEIDNGTNTHGRWIVLEDPPFIKVVYVSEEQYRDTGHTCNILDYMWRCKNNINESYM